MNPPHPLRRTRPQVRALLRAKSRLPLPPRVPLLILLLPLLPQLLLPLLLRLLLRTQANQPPLRLKPADMQVFRKAQASKDIRAATKVIYFWPSPKNGGKTRRG